MLSFQSDNMEGIIDKLCCVYRSLKDGSMVIDNPLGYKLLLALSFKIHEEIGGEYDSVPFADYMDGGYKVHTHGRELRSSFTSYPCSVRGNWYTMTGPNYLDELNRSGFFTWDAMDFSLSASIFYFMDLLDLSYDDVTVDSVTDFLEENEFEYYCNFCLEEPWLRDGYEDGEVTEEENRGYLYKCFLGAYYIMCEHRNIPFPQKYLDVWNEMDRLNGSYLSTVSYYRDFLDKIRSDFLTDADYRFSLPGYLYALFSFERHYESEATIAYSSYAYGSFDKYKEICGFTGNPMVDTINQIAETLMHPLTFSKETEGFEDMRDCLVEEIPMEESYYDADTGFYFCQYMYFSDMEGVYDTDKYLCMLSMIFELGVHYLYSIKDRLLAEAA